MIRTVTALLLLVPVDAFACINGMYRDIQVEIATQPLEFLHVGIFVSALVLLRWRGQPRKDEVWDADEVLGPDEQLLEAERLAVQPTTEPSIVRQFAFLAAALFASFGLGLFAADTVAFDMTTLTERAVWMVGFVSLALGTSVFRTGSRFLVWVRRVLLLLAVAVAGFGSIDVFQGEITEREHVPAFTTYENSEIRTQVTF